MHSFNSPAKHVRGILAVVGLMLGCCAFSQTASSVVIAPGSVTGTHSAVGTVSLAAAQGSDTVVTLVSNKSAAAVPSTVTVVAGHTSATFPVTTSAVDATVAAKISAGTASNTVSTFFYVAPPTLQHITAPSIIASGRSGQGSVSLSGPAGPSGVTVALASDLSSVQVPASVKVLAGSSGATFNFTTTSVSNVQKGHLTATVGTTVVGTGIQINGLGLDPTAPWPSFRHDNNNSGCSTFSPVLTGLTTAQNQLPPSDNFGSFASFVPGASGSLILGSIRGIQAFDGTAWTYFVQNPIGALISDAQGNFYTPDSDGGFAAYAPAVNGNVPIWRFQTGAAIVGAGALGADGCVYFGSRDGYVYCLNKNNGNLIWKYNTGSPISSSPNIDATGVLYIGGESKLLYAIDTVTGHLKWYYATHGAVKSSPAVVNGLVYFGSDDGYVYALFAATGGLAWNYKTYSLMPVESSPEVDPSGVVNIGCDDGAVYSLEATTGVFVSLFATLAPVRKSPAYDSVTGGYWIPAITDPPLLNIRFNPTFTYEQYSGINVSRVGKTRFIDLKDAYPVGSPITSEVEVLNGVPLVGLNNSALVPLTAAYQ